MSLKGGYKILDLSQNPSYEKIAKVLKTEKVILVSGLVVDDVKQKDCFASVEENEGVYTLKTPDRTITIDVVNGVEIIEGILLDSVVDKKGNQRFIEGDINVVEEEGVSYTYAKWSLSGTHLMVVLAGHVADATVLTGRKICTISLPDWVFNKITPVFGNNMEYTQLYLYADDTTTQNTAITFFKETNNLAMYRASLTLTKDRSFRILFDLLIDAE